jgi:N4-gp56 family major capsid protein
MALTNFAALTSEQKTAWARDLWRVARNTSFINQFASKGHNAMVQRIETLTKSEKGARAVLTLVADLEGDGIAGDAILEGNEESMKAYDTVIQIDQLRHANRLEGRMADQKSIVNFREQSRDKLGYWMGDRLDQMAFLSMSSLPYTLNTNGSTRATNVLSTLEFAPGAGVAPSVNRAVHLTASGINAGTGYSAADGALTSMTYADIVNLKAHAKDHYIRGIKGAANVEVYHLFVTPQGMAKLKLDPDFIANVRHAGVRGDKNSLFKGTDAVMVDGVIIHEFRHVFDTRGAAAAAKMGTSGNDNGQRALLCGAQALGMADLGTAYWDEDYFDYNNQPGIAVGKIFGFLKPQFKGNPANPTLLEDFGVITVDTAI